MEVKYLISICLIYSIATVYSLQDSESKELFQTISQGNQYIYLSDFHRYYKNANRKEFFDLLEDRGSTWTECFGMCTSGDRRMNYNQFKRVACEGLIPSWQMEEIDSLWANLNPQQNRYIGIDNFRILYGDEDMDTVWSAIQNKTLPGGGRLVGSGEGNRQIDFVVFKKAVSLGLIPRALGMHGIFKAVIGSHYPRRNYIILPDLDRYYRPGQLRTIQGYTVLSYYGVEQNGEMRLFFPQFFRAANLGYIDVPNIIIKSYPSSEPFENILDV